MSRQIGLVKLHPTEVALDDSLDRLLRFYGKANFDPEIEDTKDIRDDQEFFKNIISHR